MAKTPIRFPKPAMPAVVALALFASALPSTNARAASEGHLVALFRHSPGREQHLVLAAAPRPRCVDVEREHQRLSSSHSFANFSST